jgi:hypothetical protein
MKSKMMMMMMMMVMMIREMHTGAWWGKKNVESTLKATRRREGNIKIKC